MKVLRRLRQAAMPKTTIIKYDPDERRPGRVVMKKLTETETVALRQIATGSISDELERIPIFRSHIKSKGRTVSNDCIHKLQTFGLIKHTKNSRYDITSQGIEAIKAGTYPVFELAPSRTAKEKTPAELCEENRRNAKKKLGQYDEWLKDAINKHIVNALLDTAKEVEQAMHWYKQPTSDNRNDLSTHIVSIVLQRVSSLRFDIVTRYDTERQMAWEELQKYEEAS